VKEKEEEEEEKRERMRRKKKERERERERGKETLIPSNLNPGQFGAFKISHRKKKRPTETPSNQELWKNGSYNAGSPM
jgi:hypothetical protein